MPFFTPAEMASVRRPLPALPQCGLCGLYKGCRSPKMPVAGKGAKGILVVGEAPGADEDDRGKPFQGRSGRLLRDELEKHGVDLFRDCWVTNALICRPPNNKIEDNKAVEYCRPNVVAALEKYKPEKVLLLGYSATVSVIGYLRTIEAFQDNMATWAGWRVPSQRLNAWVCPTSHPAHVLRAEREPVVGIEWRHHIKKFCRLAGRPWKVVPDYAKEVKIEMDDRKAATILKMMAYEGDELLAFDYETNMLKPDHRDARIVSCAVSCGHTTVAYPWHGKAVEATAEILKGPNPKVAGNMKFEDRWTRARLGFPVNNLVHDTVLAAHVLDRREGITGVKFQAFVLLGQGDYDRAVDGYLHSDGGGNAKNRIKECDLKTLLLYNGIDARVEWEIAVRQRATRAVTKGTS